jgi:hypothetical protein
MEILKCLTLYTERTVACKSQINLYEPKYSVYHSAQGNDKTLATEESGFDSRQMKATFLFAAAFRLAMGPTSSNLMDTDVFFLGLNGRGVKLTPHFHPASRLRIRVYISSRTIRQHGAVYN